MPIIPLHRQSFNQSPPRILRLEFVSHQSSNASGTLLRISPDFPSGKPEQSPARNLHVAVSRCVAGELLRLLCMESIAVALDRNLCFFVCKDIDKDGEINAAVFAL